MATYSFTTTARQETIAAWVIRRLQAQAAAARMAYTGPTTARELAISWMADDFHKAEDWYTRTYNEIWADELTKALDTDTKATIQARVATRMAG